MRGLLFKTSLLSFAIAFFSGSLLTTLLMLKDNEELHKPPPPKKSPPWPADLCKDCKELIKQVRQRYSKTWKRQEDNYQNIRSQLNSNCHGSDKAIVTQANTPVGSKIVYDGNRKKTLEVNPEIFSTFVKEHPFPKQKWDTCAIVGNGGILTNSSCGKMIDSAQFVIRCNLPPLENSYEKHVGIKTDLVTANPSIFQLKFASLGARRRPFVETLRSYGNSLLLLPAFAFPFCTPLCMRAVHSIEDFEIPTRPIFFNPDYIKNLTLFWHSKGLKGARLSTGIIMASLALEHCANVHLYGFWPFSNHPQELYNLTHHYYDDMKASAVHTMSSEFDMLLQLHTEGVLRLHLGDCRPGEK